MKKKWVIRIKKLVIFTTGMAFWALALVIYFQEPVPGNVPFSASSFEALLYTTPEIVKTVAIGVFFALGLVIFSSFTFKVSND
jgi:hypothetical protein